MKKSLLLIFLLFFTACSAESITPTISQEQPNDSVIQNTNTPVPPTSTNTPEVFPTFTATQEQVQILTNEAPDQVATALNMQIEEMQVTLTAAAEEIAALNAQDPTSAPTSNSGSTSTNTQNSVYNIPSNVKVITATTDTLLFIPKNFNNAGYPIMAIYEPRIRLEAGFQGWVYDEVVQADGGGRYYRVYDPDGESSADFHFRAVDIQIRMENGDPPPAEYPTDVAKARITEKTVAYTADSFDKSGKPIMEVINPRIRFEVGNRVLLYPKPVVATGGEEYLAIYDPDGNSNAYIRFVKIEFLDIWD